MIDIRSDTVTLPTNEMLSYVANCQFGDDVFSEDPTVNELQNYTADLLGKEAALFVSSGTMGNQLSLAINAEAGDEILVEEQAHIFYYETGAPAMLSRAQLRCIHSEYGVMQLDDIKKAIRTDEYWFPKTKIICIENTHNRHGGKIIPIDNIKEIANFAHSHDILMHCDGARLWHACVETGISPKDYCEPFDTISVCLSKGIGAPVGSLIAGSKKDIERARRWRKMVGGGMRQAGIVAGAALFALKNNYQLLADTHKNAKVFANILHKCEYISLDMNRVETNMVYFSIPEKISSEHFLSELYKRNVRVIPVGVNSFRAVFHYQVSDEDTLFAGNTIVELINELNK
jgi:threonine aldolase